MVGDARVNVVHTELFLRAKHQPGRGLNLPLVFCVPQTTAKVSLHAGLCWRAKHQPWRGYVIHTYSYLSRSDYIQIQSSCSSYETTYYLFDLFV